MSRQEKRRKFNEAVLNMLYPLPSRQQHFDLGVVYYKLVQPKEEDLEAVNNLSEGFDPSLVP
ncbi:hypothetical protein PanWU01x14_298010, partial [Parasponia andersonii]